LDNCKTNYIPQKTFNDCINPKSGRKLKFDFYIPSKNLLIEYDGQQHFNPCKVKGKHNITNKEVKETRYRDKIRNQYALKNDIKLLRIKYTQFHHIDQMLEAALKA
jgi:very-short-patch-repair endonuclease